MNRWGVAVGIVGLAGALVPCAFAEEERPWKANLELSYLKTGGNSESQSSFAGAKVERTFNRSKLTGEGKAVYGESDGVTSDKNWWGRLKYDRYLNERAFAYLAEEVERDVLKGIEIRYGTQVGLGYDIINTPADLLRGEAGLGYVRENPIARDPADTVPPFDELHDLGYPSGRAFGEYTHSFAEKTRFTQTVEFIQNLKEGEEYMVKEESALIANVVGSLGLKVSYAVEYDNKPQPGFFKTDQLVKVSLLYTF